MLNPYEGGEFRVTSTYGNRNIGNGNEFHAGLDLVGGSSKRLIAIADGVIQQSRIVTDKSNLTWQWGNYVCIKADTGELIFYCHLSERLVSVGQRVKKGDPIGVEGNTGYSFGSHCHLEVRDAGNKVTATVNTPAYTGIPNKIGNYTIKEENNMAKKVFIGIGHGGSDPGAVANGFEEADLNLVIGLACATELERHGVKVKTSRTKDENDPLPEEIKECNAFGPDLAADIHINAGGGDGAEVYYYSGGGTSKTLAQNVNTAIIAAGQNSRGIKTRVNANGSDYYGWIRETLSPAIIVECAFVDSKTDMKILDTTAEQKAMGIAIAKGILKTLGITRKAPTAAKPAVKVDNTPDSYAKTAVDKAIKKGVLAGTTDGDYKLHSDVTRQDLFVFLDRLGLLK